MYQTTVTSFTAIHKGNEPAQGTRFADERDGLGKGTPDREGATELPFRQLER
jgi:hypothetical protein